MASSSSAKKVARVAAKSGSGNPAGGSTGKGRNWLFGLGIVAIVALGIGVVLVARSQNGGYGKNTTPPKANLGNGQPFDHWHAAFAIDVCGTELAPLQDGPTDTLGIHTHGDGIVHIHPFTRTAAGKRATMQKFFNQTSLTVTDTGFKLPKGMTLKDGSTTVEEGVTTCGGKPGELVMAHWKDAKNAAGAKPDKIFTKDFGNVPFTENLGAYTLAYVPKGSTDIKPPSSAANIESLGSADTGAAAGSSGTTATTAPAGSTATTAPADSTATTAAGTGG
ncbi:hypothetical protein [Aquihabitans sp. McL0605]|uniref:hypothetical protein n=1 Tax=Aquihabitans sp. McL0605 TaxID=3415671 RepID=UPI003CE75980